jgi:TIR domain
LVACLVRAGMQVWFDRDSLPNRGTTFDQEIRRAIEASTRLVLVVGPNALNASTSPFALAIIGAMVRDRVP